MLSRIATSMKALHTRYVLELTSADTAGKFFSRSAEPPRQLERCNLPILYIPCLIFPTCQQVPPLKAEWVALTIHLLLSVEHSLYPRLALPFSEKSRLFTLIIKPEGAFTILLDGRTVRKVTARKPDEFI